MFKRIFALTLAIAMISGLLGAAGAAKAENKVTLEVYVTGITADTQKWFTDTAFPAFVKTHPNITPKILTGSWGDFDTTVAGWIVTGAGPDIVYLGSEYAATYGKLLTNMDPYLKDWADLKNYLPTALDTVTFDGHMRGLPLLMSPRPIFYRTDLAKPGGADFKAPLTFADAVKFAKDNTVIDNGALTQQGYVAIGGAGDTSIFDSQEFIAALWSAGGELYKKDGSSAFDSAQTKEALQFTYDRRRAILPDETTTPLPTFTGVPIASGKIVSGTFPMWNMPPTTDKAWDNIAIAPYPAGKAGKPLVQVFVDWLSVPSYSANPQLAADFLKFLGSKDNAIAMNKVAGFTPVRKDAWDDISKTDKVWAKMFDAATKYGRAFADIRASADLRPMLVTEVNLYLTDQRSLADTMTALKSKYDAILAKNGFITLATPAATTSK